MRRKAGKARGNEKRGCARQNVFHCAAYFIAGDLRNCQQIMEKEFTGMSETKKGLSKCILERCDSVIERKNGLHM